MANVMQMMTVPWRHKWKSAINSCPTQLFREALQQRCQRHLSSGIQHFPELVDSSKVRGAFDFEDIQFYPDAITEEEHSAIAASLAKVLRTQKYEEGHAFDGVIFDYKETEISDRQWKRMGHTETLERVSELIKDLAYDKDDQATVGTVVFQPTHIVDLADSGYISGHVDSIKYSGGIVAGLSLLSSRVMRLTYHEEREDALSECKGSCIDILLPPRSLYVLKNNARYEYEHAILPALPLGSQGHRLSVIYRDWKDVLTEPTQPWQTLS